MSRTQLPSQVVVTHIGFLRGLGTLLRGKVEGAAFRSHQEVVVNRDEDHLFTRTGSILTLDEGRTIEEAAPGLDIAVVLRNTHPRDAWPGCVVVQNGRALGQRNDGLFIGPIDYAALDPRAWFKRFPPPVPAR